MARKLDEMGYTIFAGFTKRLGCEDADLLKEESSGRMTILQLDVTSERQVCFIKLYFILKLIQDWKKAFYQEYS